LIGGDTIITKRHAIFGWMTAQVNVSHYGSMEKVQDIMKKSLERYGLEPLMLDDIRKFDEVRYHYRRTSGFYHLDMMANIHTDSRGDEVALVAYPVIDDVLRENTGYSTFVAHMLANNGYKISWAPAMIAPQHMWSPTNIIVDGEKRIVYGSSPTTNLVNPSREYFASIGYRQILLDIDSSFEENFGGLHCASIIIKKGS
jgi:hypothetical protein